MSDRRAHHWFCMTCRQRAPLEGGFRAVDAATGRTEFTCRACVVQTAVAQVRAVLPDVSAEIAAELVERIEAALEGLK